MYKACSKKASIKRPIRLLIDSRAFIRSFGIKPGLRASDVDQSPLASHRKQIGTCDSTGPLSGKVGGFLVH